jgi:predicted NACHT family NTPase
VRKVLNRRRQEVQHVIIHSAILGKGNKAILFPAPPGSGKSTLTAYLAQTYGGYYLMKRR